MFNKSDHGVDAGISMGYLYLMMVIISLITYIQTPNVFQGVIISSAVIPATLTLMWSKQNLAAAALSPILGLVCSLIAWLVTAKKQGGSLSVTSTGAKYVPFSSDWFFVLGANPSSNSNPMLAGNVVALLSPLIFVPVLTYAFGPQNYDYKSMAAIRLGNDEDIAEDENTDLELIPGANNLSAEENAIEQKKLQRASIIAKSLTGFMTLCLLILWPMPMYGSAYIFSKKVSDSIQSIFPISVLILRSSSLQAGSPWASCGYSSAVSAWACSHCGREDIAWPTHSRALCGI